VRVDLLSDRPAMVTFESSPGLNGLPTKKLSRKLAVVVAPRRPTANLVFGGSSIEPRRPQRNAAQHRLAADETSLSLGFAAEAWYVLRTDGPTNFHCHLLDPCEPRVRARSDSGPWLFHLLSKWRLRLGVRPYFRCRGTPSLASSIYCISRSLPAEKLARTSHCAPPGVCGCRGCHRVRLPYPARFAWVHGFAGARVVRHSVTASQPAGTRTLTGWSLWRVENHDPSLPRQGPRARRRRPKACGRLRVRCQTHALSQTAGNRPRHRR
jgi:hypothetical protein